MSDENYLPIADCKRGHVYRLRSRNLRFGLFVPENENGFVGIRAKFGSLFLFTEHHWDNGPPFGTVKPLEDLGPLEDSTIEFWESGPTVCEKCGHRVDYVEVEGGCKLENGVVVPGRWEHLEKVDSCAEAYPESKINGSLFDALQKIEREHGLDRSPRS